MEHQFTDLEGLRIAVEMEKRGEAFYRRAARISRSEPAARLLNAMAEEERLHGQEFQALLDSACARRPCGCDELYDPETSAFLSAVAADIIFPGGLMAFRQTGFEDRRAVFSAAIASEKDSVLFYTELARCARNAHARDVFTDIAAQERRHMARLQRGLEALGDGADG